MAFGHGGVFPPRLRFVRFGRIAEIGVNSQNRLVPAENRGAGGPDSRPLIPWFIAALCSTSR